MNSQSLIYVADRRGLIGSAVVRRLQRAGYHRIITRRRSEVDLRDEEGVLQFFSQFRQDYIVLAAGRVGGIVEIQAFPADFMDEHLAIQLHVLKSARRVGLKKLIFFGSSCIYPLECSQPMPENSWLAGQTKPTSLPYTISKLTGVYLCLADNKQDGQTRFYPLIPIVYMVHMIILTRRRAMS